MRRAARALLGGLGLGFLPGPTGTWASAATVALLLAVHGPAMGPTSPGVLVAVAAGSLVTWTLAARALAPGECGDPSWVVSDEVAGQALALGLAGALPRGSAWTAVAAAFLLFRVLDVLKPGPVAAAERLPGGFGVLADDLVAGAWAGGIVLGARALGALG